MPFATPGQQPSASACDGIHQILCSKSEITVLASRTAGQAAKDSDLRICGHGQKTSAPNWTSVVQQVAAPVSSFVYRSFHEPLEWFHLPRTSSGKQLSHMRRSNLAIIARPNEIVPYKHNRVLIADDHPVVREGSSAILRSEEDIKVVGTRWRFYSHA
jgi:hypothetical protein